MNERMIFNRPLEGENQTHRQQSRISTVGGGEEEKGLSVFRGWRTGRPFLFRWGVLLERWAGAQHPEHNSSTRASTSHTDPGHPATDRPRPEQAGHRRASNGSGPRSFCLPPTPAGLGGSSRGGGDDPARPGKKAGSRGGFQPAGPGRRGEWTSGLWWTLCG